VIDLFAGVEGDVTHVLETQLSDSLPILLQLYSPSETIVVSPEMGSNHKKVASGVGLQVHLGQRGISL